MRNPRNSGEAVGGQLGFLWASQMMLNTCVTATEWNFLGWWQTELTTDTDSAHFRPEFPIAGGLFLIADIRGHLQQPHAEVCFHTCLKRGGMKLSRSPQFSVAWSPEHFSASLPIAWKMLPPGFGSTLYLLRRSINNYARQGGNQACFLPAWRRYEKDTMKSKIVELD